MNNIKPQWVVAGLFVISGLWWTEASNRPDQLPDYSRQINHLTNKKIRAEEYSDTVLSFENSTVTKNNSKPESTVPLSPLSIKLLVANRGEFFASVQANALPAQEQAILTEVLAQSKLKDDVKKDKLQTEDCLPNNCLNQLMSDY